MNELMNESPSSKTCALASSMSWSLQLLPLYNVSLDLTPDAPMQVHTKEPLEARRQRRAYSCQLVCKWIIRNNSDDNGIEGGSPLGSKFTRACLQLIEPTRIHSGHEDVSALTYVS
jgi:hypothetical protein